MAFSGGGKGPNSALTEINVTPLVDVMLVLLIIFMISAPLLQSGVQLDLPKANLEMEVSENNLVVSIDKEGKYYYMDKHLHPKVLIENLKEDVSNNSGKAVYIRADQSLPYGTVMELLSELRENGIANVSLITETVPEDS